MTYLDNFDEIVERARLPYGKPYFTLKSNGSLQRHEGPVLRRFLANHSMVFYTALFQLYNLKWSAPEVETDNEKAAALYCTLVNEIRSVAAGAHSRLVMAYTSGRIADRADTRLRSALATECAKEHGVSFVNLADDTQEREPRYYQASGYHWNVLGNKTTYDT